MAITYFLATLAILDTKIPITRLIYLNSNLNKIANMIIFTNIFATFYFEMPVKWSKSRIVEKFQLEHY